MSFFSLFRKQTGKQKPYKQALKKEKAREIYTQKQNPQNTKSETVIYKQKISKRKIEEHETKSLKKMSFNFVLPIYCWA